MRDTTDPDRAGSSDDPVTTGVPPVRSDVLTGSARLHADHGAARRARALMGEWLTAWWGPPGGDAARGQLRDRLAVVLSELVSNAVVHGAHGRDHAAGVPLLEVELHEFDGIVRLVVADRSRRPGDPAFRPPSAPALPADVSESGRGLFIVDQLADIWHAQPVSDGLVVWCDFSVDGRPLPPAGPATG